MLLLELQLPPLASYPITLRFIQHQLILVIINCMVVDFLVPQLYTMLINVLQRLLRFHFCDRAPFSGDG